MKPGYRTARLANDIADALGKPRPYTAKQCGYVDGHPVALRPVSSKERSEKEYYAHEEYRPEELTQGTCSQCGYVGTVVKYGTTNSYGPNTLYCANCD